MNCFQSLMLLLLCTVVVTSTTSAQNIKKKITVKVVDAATGRSIDGANVKLGERSTSITKTTSAEGIAYFEWNLTTDETEINLTVSEGYPARHYPFKKNFTITKQQDDYVITAQMRSENIRFNVNVIDSRTKNPVANANVMVRLADTKGNTGTTDGNGNAVLDFQLLFQPPSLTVRAEKDGYSGTEISVEIDPKISSYSVTIVLMQNKDAKFLNVIVIDEKSQPVVDASVSANGFPDIYKGTTDGSGLARILCKTGGNFTVTVRHDNFETAQQSTYLYWTGDEMDYTMQFQLKRKKAVLRNLIVTVRDQETGKIIEKASVDAENASGLTNSNGLAHLRNVLALGETGHIIVKAHGYEDNQLTYIGGGENYRYSPPEEDKVNIRLKKEKTKDVKLVVMVLDKTADVAIPKATVIIINKNGKVIMSGKTTNAKGQVEMILNKPEWENAPFRVKAKAIGYSEHWSDITSDFLNPENNPMYFTIYLEQTTPLTGEKKYGPFDVGVLQWVNTGVSIKKDQTFRVTYDTTSKVSFIREGTGEKVYMYPDGFGYWGWFVLAAKVEDEIIHVGRAGGGRFKKDGVIQLGAPRGTTFVPGDGKGTTGAWKITIYITVGK